MGGRKHVNWVEWTLKLLEWGLAEQIDRNTDDLITQLTYYFQHCPQTAFCAVTYLTTYPDPCQNCFI